MATNTTRYQLRKPVDADNVDVDLDIAGNMDLIDQDMNRFQVDIFTATGTWNKPSRAKTVYVKVVGAGGSGGGTGATGVSQGANAGGGGGGGYAEKWFDANTLASSETVTIGSGGAAAAAGANNGNNGGASSFATGKAYAVTGNGGSLGNGGAASGGDLSVSSGAGGTATGGDLNIPGGNGGAGQVRGGEIIAGNHGGASFLSTTAMITGVNTNGIAGQNYGGGSSGASQDSDSSAARPSTAGANGLVVTVTYF